MTHVGPAPISSSAVSTDGASFVEWGAVLAGAALAAAISFVLLSFGAGIGLSATSPWPNSGASAKVIASIAVFWAMAQQIGAFMVGGYVAGRMRSRWHEAGHEVEFRDGLHGGLVWAVGVVIGAALFLSTAGSAARPGRRWPRCGGPRGRMQQADPMDAVLDTMMRPITVAQASPVRSPPARASDGGCSTAPRARAVSGDESRAEMARVLASSVANGSLTAQNRGLSRAARVAARRDLPAGSRTTRRRGLQRSARSGRQGQARRDSHSLRDGRQPGPLARCRVVGCAARADTIATIRYRPGSTSASVRAASPQPPKGAQTMFRDIILWMAGVPIVVIILLHLVGALH